MNELIRKIVDNKDLKTDLHVHTHYCDGEGSVSEIVEVAIARGLDVIGFTGHAHTPFDEIACMSIEGTEAYVRDIRQAAKDYADKITVLCGIEQDYYSDLPTDQYDYVIGSVHYVEVPGEDGGMAYPSMDDTPEIFEDAVSRYFRGDVYTFAEEYYKVLSDIVKKTGADIIAHFDLFSKFNAGGEYGGAGRYFDESHPRYVAAWKKAADELLKEDVVFEINYGGVHRVRRCDPYPALEMREYIAERGGKFINVSDSHTPATLGLCRI